MNQREQAILDCKYAASLSVTTLMMHIGIWTLDVLRPTDYDDIVYQQTIIEIKSKLGTDQCLLK
jgi:hypothetical protein